MHLSVVIITYNEEKNIGRCIDSVNPVADEIVVLDSDSTDNTCDIARAKGAIVHRQPFLGYIEQANKALTFASFDFVLSLDADEALDSNLQTSIIRAKKTGFTGAYRMNRCNNYCGKFIRHGFWYPDKKLRLFNRKKAHWGGVNPHYKIILDDPQPVQHLDGDILHYSYNSLEDHIFQNNKFSTIAAESLWQQGKRTNLIKIIFNPCWAFISGYFLQMGFLDGLYGFIIARNISHLTFLKHSKLYLLQKKDNPIH